LSFFGRDIRWMTPGVISRVVKGYLDKGVIDINLIPVKDRFFAEVNTITFKSILLFKIEKLVTKLHSMDRMKHRVNILDHLWSNEELRTFLKLTEELQLELPLVDRNYWKTLPLSLRKIYIKYSYLSESFLGSSKDKIAHMKYLNLGMDVDLLMGRSLLSKTGSLWWDIRYLNGYRNRERNNYFNTQAFIDLKLSDLLKDFEKLKSIERDLLFFLPKTDLQKEVIDNPLKVLDFIKDIHNPLYKVKSDFVKWRGVTGKEEYIDSEALVDESPGFKPKFDFSKKEFTFKI
jgi:hypothetical protein